MSEDLGTPAILGGDPVQPNGPPVWPFDWPEVCAAAEQAIADGSWGRYHGPHCEALRNRLSELHASPSHFVADDGHPVASGTLLSQREDESTDLPDIVLCCSGTAAVELALRGAQVEPGDEVILAAYDFRANFQNVLTVGATPVLVDLDPQSWQLDLAQVEAALSDRTKAIIASHLHGASVDLPRLMALAESRQLTVIEDVCQATGAIVNGRRAGTQGHAGVLSFGGSKLLTAGRGGAVIASSPELAQRIRLYVERGNSAYPLSELQAALLLPQVKQLDVRNRQRLDNVRLLLNLLSDLPGLTPIFALPDPDSLDVPAFYKVGFRYTPAEFHNLSRDCFAAAVRAEGVALDPGFRSFPQTHSRRRYRAVSDLPIAAQADANIVILHHPVLLGSQLDIQTVSQAIHRVAAASDAIANCDPSRLAMRFSGD